LWFLLPLSHQSFEFVAADAGMFYFAKCHGIILLL